MCCRLILLLILCCTICSQEISGQVIERQVFASAGQSAGEFTIGEVFTQTLSNENSLTQGFHQPFLTIVGVQEESTSLLKVWPNPTRDVLHIKCDFLDYQWRILDAAGRIVLEGNGTASEDLSVAQLARGSYLLRILDSASGFNESLQFVRL